MNKQAAPQLVPEKLDQEKEKANVQKSDNAAEYSDTFEDKTGENISSIVDPGIGESEHDFFFSPCW